MATNRAECPPGNPAPHSGSISASCAAIHQCEAPLSDRGGLPPRGDGRPQNEPIAREGRVHHGREFTKNSLSNVLHNPLYTGRTPLGNESFPGLHEAIIDPELW